MSFLLYCNRNCLRTKQCALHYILCLGGLKHLQNSMHLSHRIYNIRSPFFRSLPDTLFGSVGLHFSNLLESSLSDEQIRICANFNSFEFWCLVSFCWNYLQVRCHGHLGFIKTDVKQGWKKMNEWMNKWLNYGLNKWLNAWMNEWVIE